MNSWGVLDTLWVGIVAEQVEKTCYSNLLSFSWTESLSQW